MLIFLQQVTVLFVIGKHRVRQLVVWALWHPIGQQWKHYIRFSLQKSFTYLEPQCDASHKIRGLFTIERPVRMHSYDICLYVQFNELFILQYRLKNITYHLTVTKNISDMSLRLIRTWTWLALVSNVMFTIEHVGSRIRRTVGPLTNSWRM